MKLMKNFPTSNSLFRNMLLSLILTTLLITLCYFWADPAFAFWVDHENWKRFPIFDCCTHLADLIVVWGVLYYFYFAWSFSKKKRPLEFQKNLCPGYNIANSVAISTFIKDALKIPFGRYWPATWVNPHIST